MFIIIRQNWQFFFSGDTSPIGDTSPLAQSAPTKLAIPGHFGGGPYRPEGDIYILRGLRVELCRPPPACIAPGVAPRLRAVCNRRKAGGVARLGQKVREANGEGALIEGAKTPADCGASLALG